MIKKGDKIPYVYIHMHAHTHNGILLSNKKERNLVILDNVDRPRGIMQSETSQRKTNILFHLHA